MQKIINLRKSVYRIDGIIISGLVLVIIFSYVFRPLSIVISIALFIVFYNRLRKAAHVPCPKCGEPFGASGSYPLGVGNNYCQNCGVELLGDEK
jgi:hypothetical protein